MFLPKIVAGAVLAALSLPLALAQSPPASAEPPPAAVQAQAPAVEPQSAPPAVQPQPPAVQPPVVQPQPVIVAPQPAIVAPKPPPQLNVFQPRIPVTRPVPVPPPAIAAPRPVPPAPLQPLASANAAHPGDDSFAMLRDAARAGDAAKADTYAAALGQYVIPSYVEYYRLKPRLASTPADEVRAFLARHKGAAIADRLRNDWLLELGRARDWANFDQQYPLFVLNDDTQVRCYALMARIARGDKVAEEARALLVSPPAYGDACNALVAALAQAGQFDANDLLAQLRLAGETGSTGPARRAAALLGAADTRAAQAIDLPALAMARGIGSTRAEHEIYLVAIGRMARSSLKLALVALRKNLPSLTPQEQAIGWAAVAHDASLKLDPEAWDYWQKSAGAPLTHEQVQWKTRIALRRADWKAVRSSINEMPAALRSQPAWTYWMARAMQAEPGSAPEAALALYQRIADQNSFYGQLALEELGQRISIPPPGPALSAEEIAPMANNPALRRALKFFSLRMRVEGTREWNWEMRKFSERELIAAAEFARRNDILDRMVYTSERTRTQFDYTQRFPTPHSEILSPTASQLGLDKAWVYGLIRQESRFIMDARSSAGASGLMQVMPATAQFVARKIGLGDYVRDKISDLHTNLVLGSNYLNMVLTNAGGSQPLATAAYNAGPGRMRTWRATLTEPMEGAVFAESIPFLETRVYVKNVMSNATNYAALFENKPQSLKARLGRIAPRSAAAGELP
jgi:soluble lytic murein transglycosylase